MKKTPTLPTTPKADLLAWIEDYKARNTFTEIIWVIDDHSCRPYFDTTSFQHRLVEHLPVPLPPLSEQKRIVTKIEELFGVMKN